MSENVLILDNVERTPLKHKLSSEVLFILQFRIILHFRHVHFVQLNLIKRLFFCTFTCTGGCLGLP